MSQRETDIAIPIARNDEETLEERMTNNAYERILPSRYLKKDGDGNPIEEPEDLFPRVAKNIAIAELVHLDNLIQIQSEHIKPDHPRRQKLIEEVFGEPSVNRAPLTEENAKYVSYDAILPDLDDNAREHLQEWKETFQEMMEHLKFIPNTPTLKNAGNELQQLSACFVNSPEDDMRDIHETALEASLIFQSGGGLGYDFSRLRPYGDTVGSTGGIASGPITFMETYDQVCQTVAQGGIRRGAQMGNMRIDHPDVIYFIHSKRKDVSLANELRLNDPDDPKYSDFGEAVEEAREYISDGKVPEHLRNAVEGHLSNFNISVTVTDEFMESLQNEENYKVMNPRTGEQHIATEETVEMYEWFDFGKYVEVGEPVELPAEEVWNRIVEGAWENGEPGVIYIDEVNRKHSFDVDEHPEHEIRATNPCAEQALEEYEACNLGHINLSTIVDEERTLWNEWKEENDADAGPQYVQVFLDKVVDWEELNTRISHGTRFLDNVVTMSDFPIDEIEDKVSQMRKIGLGIMGLAQFYIQIGVEYGSEEANEIARQLMMHINHESKGNSHILALERGAFEEWEDSKYANPTEYPDWFRQMIGKNPENWEDGYLTRNHSTTTIAPTGTTSMVGNTTGGCEPIYNVAFFKNVSPDIQGDEMLVEFDSFFLRVLEANGIDVEKVKEEAKRLMDNNEYEGVHNLESVPDEIADLFVTTDQLTGKEHASVLCACQKGVDSGISKTCNFPESATVEEMDEVYRYIYENGGKSVTVYRDGTRSKQVITTRSENQEEKSAKELVEEEFGVSMDTIEEALDALGTAREAREVPDKTHGTRYRITTGYGKLYVNINEDEYGLIEIFATVGKSGGFTESFCEALARMVSLNLRWGVPVEEVIDQLEGIRSPQSYWDDGDRVDSIPDGIALALKRHIGHDTVEEIKEIVEEAEKSLKNEGVEEVVSNGSNPECDECGSMLIIQEGCEKCPVCGWSKC